MYKQKISAAILTYNSEKRIGEVLEQLSWCDEIIILDSFSSDNTLEICRNHNATIFQNVFKDFGSQKQLLMSKCKNKWIISIDSDEVLSDELIKNIMTLNKEDFENNAGFLINRKHVFLNNHFKYGKESNMWILRLFDKTKGGVTNNIVHESIEVIGSTAKIKGELLHFTIDELHDAVKKMDLYAQLKAKEYFKKGKKSKFIKLYITFPFTFFREYFLNRNLLNGYEGYLWSILVAQGAGLKYHYLRELANK